MAGGFLSPAAFLLSIILNPKGEITIGYTQITPDGLIRQLYDNEKGTGIFYPAPGARLNGIARVYGLAYVDEGWLEAGRGVGRVEVQLGAETVDARTYVKDRYFVRTFDTGQWPDGPLTITARAFDKEGGIIGAVAQTVIIDNASKPERRRLFASADGLPDKPPCEDPPGGGAPGGESPQDKPAHDDSPLEESLYGDGSFEHPWDAETALAAMQPGDILFLRGGVYDRQLTITASGAPGCPCVIMNYRGERVEVAGYGLEIADGVSNLILSGIDQHGTRANNFGINIGADIERVSIWDCSFCDNTHPYADLPSQPQTEYGTGVYAGVIRSRQDRSRIRRYLELSHCYAEGNDVDGFHLASIARGRFQFLESCWTPDTRGSKHKQNVYQWKHANGFAADNSEYRWNGYASEDITYLFCYSHHNGQDGWDIRSPHTRLFGCVTHDEAYVGVPFGGVGLKFWEYDYHIANCVTFRNNIVDGTGDAFTLAVDIEEEPGSASYSRKNAYIHNCDFYHADNDAINLENHASEIRIENCAIERAKRAITFDVAKMCVGYIRRCIFFQVDGGTVAERDEPLSERIFESHIAEPGFTDPERGNFFPKKDSLLLAAGNTHGLLFDVGGVDYSKFDGLGRPRAGEHEVGAYTRYERDIVKRII